MHEPNPSLAITSTPTAVILSQEGQAGSGSIRIPVQDIDTVCELLRQAKLALVQSPLPPLPESPGPVPLPLSVPEDQVAEWAAAPAAPEESAVPEEAGGAEEVQVAKEGI